MSDRSGRSTLADAMSGLPYTIWEGATLDVAHRLMNVHGIRHLPVLRDGRLVGILSQRDLHLVETLKDVDPAEATVGEAMSTDVYTAGPRASLRRVAAVMAERKLGCTVVVSRDRVVGMFTTVDALHALESLLREARRAVVVTRAPGRPGSPPAERRGPRRRADGTNRAPRRGRRPA